MKIEYHVDNFNETLIITFPEGYEWAEEEILLMLEDFYQEWHSADEIEDDTERAMIMDSDLYDYIMGRLSETYNTWEEWEVRKEF
jgi:hypothetical protein